MTCTAREGRRDEIHRSIAALNGVADLVLLAGDLTTHGEPEQGAVLADACAALDVPVFAVLGNHDWHVNRRDELVAVLEAAGIHVLDRGWHVCEAGGLDVGIVGTEGLRRRIPRVAPARLRRTTVARRLLRDHARRAGARPRACARSRCARRASCCCTTRRPSRRIVGEPPGIWGYLGTDRLAPPIAEHEPDLVLHGHAHAGTFEGAIGKVPIYNVSVPVIARDFWLFELHIPTPAHAPIH